MIELMVLEVLSCLILRGALASLYNKISLYFYSLSGVAPSLFILDSIFFNSFIYSS